jgi:hypothetical protein
VRGYRTGLAIALFAAILSLAAAPVPAPTEGATPGGPIYVPPANQNISGVWWGRSYSPKIELVGGGELPFTPAGLAKYRETMAGLADGSIRDEARRVCVPDGVPRILGNPYPFQIFQVPGEVAIVYELNRVIRFVPLDVPMPAAEELLFFPYYSGTSVGRWEGDTLVVETTGFNEKTFIDATGVPHSDQLRTVERMKKLDDKTLEVVVEVTDPVTFTRPWSARYVYDLHPDLRLDYYHCGDEHRDISHIPGVRRPQ